MEVSRAVEVLEDHSEVTPLEDEEVTVETVHLEEEVEVEEEEEVEEEDSEEEQKCK